MAEEKPEDTPEDKTLTDKATATAKDVAATAKDVASTAKEKVSDFASQHQDKIDKAKDVAVTAKEKVVDFVGQHEDKIDSAIDKAGGFVDKKVTKERFTDKIERAQEATKGAVAKIAGSDGDEKDQGKSETPPAE